MEQQLKSVENARRASLARWGDVSLEERFWTKVGKSGEHWLWTASVDAYGYGQFKLPGGRIIKAHRQAYELVHGPLAAAQVVRHGCHIRRCCNPACLSTGTRADNNADTRAAGRHSFGSKLTARTAQLVRQLYFDAGWDARRLARWFRLSVPHVREILSNEHWNSEEALYA